MNQSRAAEAYIARIQRELYGLDADMALSSMWSLSSCSTDWVVVASRP